VPTSLTVTKDSCGRYFLSFVVDTEPDILPPGGDRRRYRPGPVRLRGPVRRAEDRQPALPAPGGEETQAPSAGAVPQAERVEEPGQGPPQGRTPARQGGQPTPGLPPQGIHTDHPRQPSGVRGRPRGVRSRPHPARPVCARRGMVRVRRHAGVQGGSARPHLHQGGPGLPVLAGLFGLRIPGRPQAAARSAVDVRSVRQGARP
jgi:putative transposase